jgi:hypothetical protein
MIMRQGQVYRCQNPRCGAELQVERESLDGFSNPICCCGAEMTRRYDAPALRKAEPSAEVLVLLKLLAKLHGFDLVEKSGNSVSTEPTGLGETPEAPLEPGALSGAPAEASRPLPLDKVREIHIQRVLEICAGNRARAAQMLGISRNSLYRTLKRNGQVRSKQSAQGEAGGSSDRSESAELHDVKTRHRANEWTIEG